MANFQYKTTGAWGDVPKEAYQGTYEGSFSVLYAQPESYDGNGRRCGTVGNPTLRLQANIMTACGLLFWQNLIGATAQDAAISITAINPHTAAWSGWTGYLEHPTWARVSHGSSSANTFYYDVNVVVNELTSTTWP
jgi:hypothetical protein